MKRQDANTMYNKNNYYTLYSVRLREAARWQLTQNCFCQLTDRKRSERLSEKVHATISKGIVVGGFEFSVL